MLLRQVTLKIEAQEIIVKERGSYFVTSRYTRSLYLPVFSTVPWQITQDKVHATSLCISDDGIHSSCFKNLRMCHMVAGATELIALMSQTPGYIFNPHNFSVVIPRLNDETLQVSSIIKH